MQPLVPEIAPGTKVVVGFSGGVTSAWCAGWALRKYPREDVVLLWHDTKEEHPDTYRFLHEMAVALNMPITERSDGRSVTELFRDEGFLGNNQNAMCSRVLKVEQGERFIAELLAQGHQVMKVLGYSEREWQRMQRAQARAEQGVVLPPPFSTANNPTRQSYLVAFPVAAENVSKQETADWCLAQGVRPSAMYCWAEHANCIGCVKGGRAYWLAVAQHAPDVFEQRAVLEEEFGHTIIRGGGRESVSLRELVQIGLKRTVNPRESITIGACECGD